MPVNIEMNHNLLKGYIMLLNFAGSLISKEPSTEMINEFWTTGILRKLPVSSMNPKFVKAASILRGSCDEKLRCEEKIRDDYRRLFNGSASPFASPYESLYKSNYQNIKGKKPVHVTIFYDSYGLKSRIGIQKPDDHLGTELLFLTLLIDKYLELDDKYCKVEMRSEIRRFIDQHILSWIGEWNEKVQLNSFTNCYKGIGMLILACSEDLYQILSD